MVLHCGAGGVAQGAHVSQVELLRRPGVCVTGARLGGAAAAASRQRLRYAASAAVSRQESRRRAANTSTSSESPITASSRAVLLAGYSKLPPTTAAAAVTLPSGKSGAHRERRSALAKQQVAASAQPTPLLPLHLPLRRPPQAATRQPLSSHLTSRAAANNSTLALQPTLRLSNLPRHQKPLAVARASSSYVQTRSPVIERKPYLNHHSAPPTTSNNNSSPTTTGKHLLLTASSKFSLNSSTSSLTLASVKRARKAPTCRESTRRASGSLAELSNYGWGTGVGPSSRPAQAASSALTQRPGGGGSNGSQRRARSSHRRQSVATTNQEIASIQARKEASASKGKCFQQQHSSVQALRAKSAASGIHWTGKGAATSSCCCYCCSVATGSGARQSSGRASDDSGLGLVCCGDECSGGDTLALQKRLLNLQSSSEVEAPLDKSTTGQSERRASFEGSPKTQSEHIASPTMRSNATSNSSNKPLASIQQQEDKSNSSKLRANNNKQQVKKQQPINNNNNNFLLDNALSYGILEQLENQPPPDADVEQQEDDADKMSLGSPLVTPPPSELITQDHHQSIQQLSPNRPPDIAIRTNPITDLYDLETKPFARGKFAQVKRCIHRLNKQCFAAKCIKKRRRSSDTRHEIMLEIEALTLSYFTDRIVKLFEVYETSSEMILVLEMAKGGELQRILDEEERIAEPRAVQMVAQILDGLIYLHDNDIAHLDIKPQNLLLTDVYPLGDIKLCDFGISRRITKDCEIRDICGTPDYVAPEILRYDPINLATDMWSLGVLTYILLSGYSPFGSDNKQQTFCNITQAELEFPIEIFDNISPEAIDFIKKLILREPSQRLTSRQARKHPWLAKEKPIQP